jgi:hypothetical protein
MKGILITDRLYESLKTIAKEQNEQIKVIYTPSQGAGPSDSLDERNGLCSIRDCALAAASESGDHAEYRRFREEQKATME